jgi:hypothetical protein
MIAHTEFLPQTVEWMQARAGIPTASEFDQLVTPEFKIRNGQMPLTYLAKKVAERWLGGPLADFNSFDMDQGTILEQEAIPWYELEYGETIQRIPFITTDDGRVGCSPDGILADGGIEIKCPAVHTHVGYLLDGKLPKDYAVQVHGSMFVTGAKWWKFLAYRRRLPPLVLKIERDEAIQDVLKEALEEFCSRLDMAFARLVQMNGGPPDRRPISKPDPAWMSDENDVVTP